MLSEPLSYLCTCVERGWPLVLHVCSFSAHCEWTVFIMFSNFHLLFLLHFLYLSLIFAFPCFLSSLSVCVFSPSHSKGRENPLKCNSGLLQCIWELFFFSGLGGGFYCLSPSPLSLPMQEGQLNCGKKHISGSDNGPVPVSSPLLSSPGVCCSLGLTDEPLLWTHSVPNSHCSPQT